MGVLIFSTNCSEIFLVSRIIKRDTFTNVSWCSCKVSVIILNMLIKTEFAKQVLEKCSNIKFRKNPSSGNRVVPCGRKNGQTSGKLTAALRHFVNVPENAKMIKDNKQSMYERETNIKNNYENNQQDALYRLIYYSNSAVYVSGEVFAHHQEHLTVFTVSGSVHPRCCRLVSRRDTSRQQRGLTLPDTVNTVKCS